MDMRVAHHGGPGHLLALASRHGGPGHLRQRLHAVPLLLLEALLSRPPPSGLPCPGPAIAKPQTEG